MTREPLSFLLGLLTPFFEILILRDDGNGRHSDDPFLSLPAATHPQYRPPINTHNKPLNFFTVQSLYISSHAAHARSSSASRLSVTKGNICVYELAMANKYEWENIGPIPRHTLEVHRTKRLDCNRRSFFSGV